MPEKGAVAEWKSSATAFLRLCARKVHKNVENFSNCLVFWHNKPDPTQSAAPKQGIFSFEIAKRPEFQKDAFLVARSPASSRAFSG